MDSATPPAAAVEQPPAASAAAPEFVEVALNHPAVDVDRFIDAKNKGETTVKVTKEAAEQATAAAAPTTEATTAAEATTETAAAAEAKPAAPAKPAKKPSASEQRRLEVQQDIDRLTAIKHQTQREVEQLEAKKHELAAMPKPGEEKPNAAAPKPSETAATESAPMPSIEDFETIADFQTAVAKWTREETTRLVTVAMDARDKKTAKERADAEAAARGRQTLDSHTKLIEEFKQDHPDFDDVVKNPDLKITPLMSEVLMGSAVGEQMAYHLGSNAEEAARIAALPAARQLMEMGALEKTFKPRTAAAPQAPVRGPAASRVETPPPPISPRGGGRTSSASPGAGTEDFDAWAATRNRDTIGPRA